METFRIRDGKMSDPGSKKDGSGINILDPQHKAKGNTVGLERGITGFCDGTKP
jgi:hypothetical protein